jgi:excisionase family DNA binding protein
VNELRRTVEAAGRLKVHPATLRRWAREGKIPAVRIGRHLQFLDSDIEACIRSHRRVAA